MFERNEEPFVETLLEVKKRKKKKKEEEEWRRGEEEAERRLGIALRRGRAVPDLGVASGLVRDLALGYLMITNTFFILLSY